MIQSLTMRIPDEVRNEVLDVLNERKVEFQEHVNGASVRSAELIISIIALSVSLTELGLAIYDRIKARKKDTIVRIIGLNNDTIEINTTISRNELTILLKGAENEQENLDAISRKS